MKTRRLKRRISRWGTTVVMCDKMIVKIKPVLYSNRIKYWRWIILLPMAGNNVSNTPFLSQSFPFSPKQKKPKGPSFPSLFPRHTSQPIRKPIRKSPPIFWWKSNFRRICGTFSSERLLVYHSCRLNPILESWLHQWNWRFWRRKFIVFSAGKKVQKKHDGDLKFKYQGRIFTNIRTISISEQN